MADFTVRVELHEAGSDDYENLHEAMASQGYSKMIQDQAGNWFYLPTAEYTASKNLSAAQVREQVVGIAKAIKVNPRVLVTQVADRSWALVKR
ncbi:type V toxin-antitoxin system endoribonuclease antitoxin GhoS [Serratia ureilytica]|uniref:type V toxin-antitoxin system endoribonuclease antitoxin GhoS n=1 Tax=Serratia ureilytica TaxID=300181 RepID=UPI0018D6D0BE|nr:type V toxin-antitoxin system endoribonuclease antitoxin GhoS [Serratia ureilytica]MBH3122430.1 type V toxin-antitoxin system endoribonuclease antitoxin GhoS [Serratia ureilytica]